MNKRIWNSLSLAALLLVPSALLRAGQLDGCDAPLPQGVYRVSSPYGMRMHPLDGAYRMHKGIDLACPLGTPVYAVGSGVVTFAGRWGCYGNVVVLRHNGGDVLTLYAHLSRISPLLHSGAGVVQGEIIGLVGATGCVTGPHLHLEYWKAGKRINPLMLCASLHAPPAHAATVKGGI